ncbi:hypothetical protein AJ78_03341 [Emergomyces pasteurianus Ep9510]|uniref:F-box domain-containing protein n=1 Tax=Emergomyces pasteurianus Ep9510 TaxID=1447872 RepID=A0A1J9PK99_9EURO|nr:hypothetical protein AJ78_03341 [Emergomyces pasteurianus Ep9510]
MGQSEGLKLSHLPAELLHQIFRDVDYGDRKNLRLVCRVFANACVPYMIHSCTFSTSRDSLSKLKHMAMHPLFSAYIDVLNFDCSLLVNIPNQYRFHSHLRFLNESMEQSQRQFQVYWPLVEAQNEIILSGEDVRTVELAIPRFQKFTTLRICIGSFENSGRQHKEAFAGNLANVPFYAIRQSSACSVRQFMTLMNTLFRQQVRISVLEIGPLTYSVFDEDLELVQEVFSSLTKLVFYISAVADTPWPPKAQASFSGSEAFCDVVGNGKAVKLLSSASQLTHLSICTEYAPFHKEANLKSFVGNYTWPHLKRFSIGNLVVSENDLIDFLHRHRIEELSIRSITLQGSWITALPAMREATSPILDRAIAYEWITNEAGESWYLGHHPAKSIVGRGDETTLGLYVAYYLSKAPCGYPCPLTLSNMS